MMGVLVLVVPSAIYTVLVYVRLFPAHRMIRE